MVKGPRNCQNLILSHLFYNYWKSYQYLTILLIAKTTYVKVIIKRSLLGAPFEESFPTLSFAKPADSMKRSSKKNKKISNYAKY